MEKITYAQMFDYLSDLFDNVKWSESTLIEVGNTLIERLTAESDPEMVKHTSKIYDRLEVTEAMLNALHTLVLTHDVSDKLNLSPLTAVIHTYDRECTETLLSILSCTHQWQYKDIITENAARFPELSAEEFLAELGTELK
ncbi:hypothetical protein [Ruminococcus sp.]|uniref:hypothetical protein n=1 Tax=Ruminococcus sp. TaxID=41978 RepID=UPI0025F0458F|nr:hypothetical protein [Ruminococcus sp.]MBQ8968000.1 hypothetical protein [Ruminococcus sp.]